MTAAPATVTVRPAVLSDLPALAGLLSQLGGPVDASLPATAAAWRAVLTQPGRRVLVAGYGTVLAGTADTVLIPNLTHDARPYLLVENVVVDAAHRRTGVGQRLMAAVLDRATGTGCYKVQLLSRRERAGAHAFYEACGFTPSAQGYRRYLDDGSDPLS